jgi:hypothetical protein
MSDDLKDIERRIKDGIYGDDWLSDTTQYDACSAVAEIIAEVDRLRAEAANWRTVRDEVLRLDGRPGTMADDDVLSIVGAVLQRAVQSGEHRREGDK